MGNEDDNKIRVEFWTKAAAIGFGAWALMIPIGVSVLRNALAEAATADMALRHEFSEMTLSYERRLSVLETRQTVVLERLTKVEMLCKLKELTK